MIMRMNYSLKESLIGGVVLGRIFKCFLAGLRAQCYTVAQPTFLYRFLC